MPAYRYMHSYPFQGTQTPPQQYNPSFEAIPPHMKVDPSKSTIVYAPWPYANDFGFPIHYHPCCSYRNFPGYNSFRPPCAHLPANQFYCCGHHPPIPETFPVWDVPPPCYSIQHPQCEYDKNISKEHCCVCPNHTHNQMDERSVKIEEQEPEVEKKESNSLVPFQLKDYPYPLVWIPPEYMKRKENKKTLESEIPRREKAPQERRHCEGVQQSFEPEPRALDGWFPLDMKSLGSFMQDEDGNRNQNHQNGDKVGQLPFPIIWMPSYNKQNEVHETDKEEHKETNAAPRTTEEPLSAVKVFSFKFPNSSNTMNKSQAAGENPSNLVNPMIKENCASHKIIPVNETEESMEKSVSADIASKEDAAFLKNAEEKNVVSKVPETNAKRQSSSPPKTSKLPPVCLRVDPLPKKRNGNGSSRSPSSPGLKGRSVRDTFKDPTLELKANTLQDPEVGSSISSNSEKVDVMKNNGKFMKAADMEINEKKAKDAISESQLQVPVTLPVDSGKEAPKSPVTERTGKEDDDVIIKEDKGLRDTRDLKGEDASEAKESTDATRLANHETKAVGKKLSDNEAALLIQSAYRGYEVRKWEPLKKLKQIAIVREQTEEVSNQVHALGSSDSLQKDDRQMVVVGEMIMNLLLKLDSIQGLHPSLRDVRKSLAKELVQLQEKLDSLLVKKSQEIAIAKPPEDPYIDHGNVTDMQERKSKGEQPHHDVSQTMDAIYDGRGKEIAKPEEQHEELRLGARESLAAINLESCVAEHDIDHYSELSPPGDFEQVRAIVLEGTSQDPNGEVQSMPVGSNQLMCIGNDQGLDELKELPGVDEEPTVADEGDEQVGTGINTTMHDEETKLNVPAMNQLAELPLGVVDKEKPENESEKQKKQVICSGDVQPDAANDMSSPAVLDGQKIKAVEINSLAKLLLGDEKVTEMDLLTELPIEVINEEEPEKCEHSMMQEVEVLQGGNVENKAATVESLQDKGVPIEDGSEQQSVQVLNEGLSIAESKDFLEEGSQKHVNSPGDAMFEGDLQHPLTWEVNNISRHLEELGSEEVQEISSQYREGSDDEAHKEIIHMDLSSIPDATNKVITMEKKEVQAGQNAVDQPRADGEEMAQKEKEIYEQRELSGIGEIVEQPNGSDIAEDSFMVAPHSASMCLEHTEDKMELLPMSSTASELSIDKWYIEMEGERKLIEENQKLREMMEKLMEAGKAQLAAISNLTGRVEGIEKKLSRKKKSRARRCRTAISPNSNARSSNDTLRKSAVGVAM